MPSNHELFETQPLYELFAQWYWDYYEANPLESYRGKDGEVQFKNTGDSMIDKWEEQLADGLIPDLWEGFDPATKKYYENKGNKKPAKAMTIKEAHDIIANKATRNTGTFNVTDDERAKLLKQLEEPTF